jgi:hypothetical protein
MLWCMKDELYQFESIQRILYPSPKSELEDLYCRRVTRDGVKMWQPYHMVFKKEWFNCKMTQMASEMRKTVADEYEAKWGFLKYEKKKEGVNNAVDAK